MKKRQRTNTRKGLNVEGITLIALVVTIVVLLILASVSVTVVFGDNGILQLAKEAGEKTNEAKDKDLRQITIAEALMHFENTKYTDKNGKTITVPAGFAVSGVEGENVVDEGLVIIDSKGNEFVWVPVDGVEEGDKVISVNSTNSEEGNNEIQKDEKNGKIIYRQDTKTWKEKANANYKDYKDWWDEENITERKESVKKYGGFYVARYEAGVPESINYDETTKYTEKSNEANRNKSAKEVTKENLPASRKGLQAWNYVSQTVAKGLSERMYEDSTSVTSRLIDSQAWDTICHWLSKDNKYDVTDSTSWGNYVNADSGEGVNGLYSIHSIDYNNGWTCTENQGNYKRGSVNFEARSAEGEQTLYELATGISERNKAKNIYDFAGNMWEWTTEKGNHSKTVSETKTEPKGEYAVIRGGCFYTGSSDLASRRDGTPKVGNCVVHISFRPVLYLK